MYAQTSMDPSRRRFLLDALLAMLAGGLVGCATTFPSTRDADRSAQWWGGVIGDGAGMARFGDAYLKRFPGERDLELLWHALLEAMERQGAERPAVADPGRAFIYLDRAVRDEYRRGEVVDVESWLISRSEARLYAAATLL